MKVQKSSQNSSLKLPYLWGLLGKTIAGIREVIYAAVPSVGKCHNYKLQKVWADTKNNGYYEYSQS